MGPALTHIVATQMNAGSIIGLYYPNENALVASPPLVRAKGHLANTPAEVVPQARFEVQAVIPRPDAPVIKVNQKEILWEEPKRRIHIHAWKMDGDGQGATRLTARSQTGSGYAAMGSVPEATEDLLFKNQFPNLSVFGFLGNAFMENEEVPKIEGPVPTEGEEAESGVPEASMEEEGRSEGESEPESELSSVYTVSDCSLASISSWESATRRGLNVNLPANVTANPAPDDGTARFDICRAAVIGVVGARRVQKMVGSRKANELLSCLPEGVKELVPRDVGNRTLSEAARDLSNQLGPNITGVVPHQGLAVLVREFDIREQQDRGNAPGGSEHPWPMNIGQFAIAKMVNIMPPWRPASTKRSRRRMARKRVVRRERMARDHERAIEESSRKTREAAESATRAEFSRPKEEPRDEDMERSRSRPPTPQPPRASSSDGTRAGT
eukprot:GHVU01088774.1.p1 GENE.GHVU01088774.1~~GHVU01088774.1.p1  ORF type:complete len:486 (+),score=46.76 GHVU01088774.1:138-1460(+)